MPTATANEDDKPWKWPEWGTGRDGLPTLPAMYPNEVQKPTTEPPKPQDAARNRLIHALTTEREPSARDLAIDRLTEDLLEELDRYPSEAIEGGHVSVRFVPKNPLIIP